jgi:hypothetical protein
MKNRFTQSVRSFVRAAMAFVIACALVLSFFHDFCVADGPAEAAASTAIVATLDTSTKAPAPHHAPGQCDHCLTHLASKPWQEPVAVPAEFSGAAYLARNEAPPHPMAGLLPFKPPCA